MGLVSPRDLDMSQFSILAIHWDPAGVFSRGLTALFGSLSASHRAQCSHSHLLFIPRFSPVLPHFSSVTRSLARETLRLFLCSPSTSHHSLTAPLTGLPASLSLSAVTRQSAFTRRAIHMHIRSTPIYGPTSNTPGSFQRFIYFRCPGYQGPVRYRFVYNSRFFHQWLHRSRNPPVNLSPLPFLCCSSSVHTSHFRPVSHTPVSLSPLPHQFLPPLSHIPQKKCASIYPWYFIHPASLLNFPGGGQGFLSVPIIDTTLSLSVSCCAMQDVHGPVVHGLTTG